MIQIVVVSRVFSVYTLFVWDQLTSLNKLSDLDILQKFQNHFSSNDNNSFHYHNNYNNYYYYDYHHDYNNDHDDNNYNARYRITEKLFKYLDFNLIYRLLST